MINVSLAQSRVNLDIFLVSPPSPSWLDNLGNNTVLTACDGSHSFSTSCMPTDYIPTVIGVVKYPKISNDER